MKQDVRDELLDMSPLYLLHRAGQFADDMFSKENRQTDMTPRQYAVLACVARNENLSQADIVARTGIDRSTLADIVRRLAGQNLLERERTREDARRYAVKLTDKGMALFKVVEPAAKATDEHILSTLLPAERDTFLKALSQIVQTMDSRDRAAAKDKSAS